MPSRPCPPSLLVCPSAAPHRGRGLPPQRRSNGGDAGGGDGVRRTVDFSGERVFEATEKRAPPSPTDQPRKAALRSHSRRSGHPPTPTRASPALRATADVPSDDDGSDTDDSAYATFLAFLGGDDGAVAARAGGPSPRPPSSTGSRATDDGGDGGGDDGGDDGNDGWPSPLDASDVAVAGREPPVDEREWRGRTDPVRHSPSPVKAILQELEADLRVVERPDGSDDAPAPGPRSAGLPPDARLGEGGTPPPQHQIQAILREVEANLASLPPDMPPREVEAPLDETDAGADDDAGREGPGGPDARRAKPPRPAVPSGKMERGATEETMDALDSSSARRSFGGDGEGGAFPWEGSLGGGSSVASEMSSVSGSSGIEDVTSHVVVVFKDGGDVRRDRDAPAGLLRGRIVSAGTGPSARSREGDNEGTDRIDVADEGGGRAVEVREEAPPIPPAVDDCPETGADGAAGEFETREEVPPIPPMGNEFPKMGADELDFLSHCQSLLTKS